MKFVLGLHEQGFQILEAVLAMSILTVALVLGIPPLLRITGDFRLRLTAQEMVGVLRSARAFAARHSANVAVRFSSGPGDGVTYAIYRDGDGDGVLTKDIASGVDPAISPPHQLSQSGARARIGFPPGRRVKDPGSPSEYMSTTDPIRFNQSDLASFSRLGTSTSGSLYLTDGGNRLVVIRVLGRTGKVRVLAYDYDHQVWR